MPVSDLRMRDHLRPTDAGATIGTVRMKPMREIVFSVLEQAPDQLLARSLDGRLEVSATSLEELRHEAREALIAQLGPAHVACRIRLVGLRVGRRPMPTGWHRPRHPICAG
mgnify:CR=1 FL=1